MCSAHAEFLWNPDSKCYKSWYQATQQPELQLAHQPFFGCKRDTLWNLGLPPCKPVTPVICQESPCSSHGYRMGHWMGQSIPSLGTTKILHSCPHLLQGWVYSGLLREREQVRQKLGALKKRHFEKDYEPGEWKLLGIFQSEPCLCWEQEWQQEQPLGIPLILLS